MKLASPIIAASAAALILSAGACSPNWKVKRIDPEQTVDLDYRFDDEDAKQIARGMIADALSKPWVAEYMAVNEKRPLVVVGNVKNETEDYINPDLFTDVIQEELLNSGKVRFIADAALFTADPVNFHPLTNTATTAVSRDDFRRFVESTGHACDVLDFASLQEIQ